MLFRRAFLLPMKPLYESAFNVKEYSLSKTLLLRLGEQGPAGGVQLASLPRPLIPVYIGCLLLHRFNREMCQMGFNEDLITLIKWQERALDVLLRCYDVWQGYAAATAAAYAKELLDVIPACGVVDNADS
jgi:hypothetical protein